MSFVGYLILSIWFHPGIYSSWGAVTLSKVDGSSTCKPSKNLWIRVLVSRVEKYLHTFMRMLCFPRVTHVLKAVKTKCLPIKIGLLKSLLAGVNGKSLCYLKDDIQTTSLWLSADRKHENNSCPVHFSGNINTGSYAEQVEQLWQKVTSGSLYTRMFKCSFLDELTDDWHWNPACNWVVFGTVSGN